MGNDGGGCSFTIRGNYHWSLKYDVRFDRGVVPSCVACDAVEEYKASIMLHDVTAEVVDMAWPRVWDVATTSQKGTVTVIDGHSVNLTKAGEV